MLPSNGATPVSTADIDTSTERITIMSDIFNKAWEFAKLSPYEMAVAEEFSDPRDFMTASRMREALGGMPYHEVVRMANHPEGDLDFRYMPYEMDRSKQAGQIESLADEDVKAIYEQMMRLKKKPRVQDMQGDYGDT